MLKRKFWKKKIWKKCLEKTSLKTEILITKIYNINKGYTFFALPVPFDKKREKDRE